MNPLRIVLPFLFATAVLGHGYGGGQRVEYDCGGTCGGGCGYGNPCNQAPAAPIISSGGCDGDCGGSSDYSSGGGGYSRHTSGRSSHSGYHKSSTTITKETRNDELKIVLAKPVVNVRTTYVEPQPVIRKTTYIQEPAPAPVVYHKKQRYVDEGDYSGGSGCVDGCGGGGSKIVKIIRKTTYAGGDGGSCSTCGSGGYSSNYEYSEPAPVVRKVTRIVTQPKIVTTRVIKTVVGQAEPSGEYYDSGSSYSGGGHHRGYHGGGGHHGHYGRQKQYGGGGGGASAKAGAFAYASASASAGAIGGSGSGDYTSGGGGGCKSGCDEWKK